MRRKITQAMARREGELLLRGIVELDEGFIGGKRCRPASRGRRQPGKTMVASAAGSVVQSDAWKGYAGLGRRLRPSPSQVAQRRRRRSVAALLAHRARQLLPLDTGHLPWRQPRAPAGIPRRARLAAQSPRAARGHLPAPVQSLRTLQSPGARFPAHCYLSDGDGHVKEFPLPPRISVTLPMRISERSY